MFLDSRGRRFSYYCKRISCHDSSQHNSVNIPGVIPVEIPNQILYLSRRIPDVIPREIPEEIPEGTPLVIESREKLVEIPGKVMKEIRDKTSEEISPGTPGEIP